MTGSIKQADLAIEPIPYRSDLFDLVTAYDFMEHIPPLVYLPSGRRSCLIELVNEIYRVLVDGGEFYMVSPYYQSPDAFRDPTHVSFWTEHTAHYFSGDYFGQHDLYNHTSKFELLENRVAGARLHIRMKAIKPADWPFEVGAVT